jgi:hypothetical protein
MTLARGGNMQTVFILVVAGVVAFLFGRVDNLTARVRRLEERIK